MPVSARMTDADICAESFPHVSKLVIHTIVLCLLLYAALFSFQ